MVAVQAAMKVRAFVDCFLQRFMGFIQRLWTGDFSEGPLFAPADTASSATFG